MTIAIILVGLGVLCLCFFLFRGRQRREDTTPVPPSPEDVSKMATLAKDLQEVMAVLGRGLEPGMSTKELDRSVITLLKEKDMMPAMLGYNGFPAAIATSRNEVVLHGIPSRKVRIEDGDLVTLQVSAKRDGVHAAMGWTFPVGNLSPEREKLLESGQRALDLAVQKARVGARTGDIGAAIQGAVEGDGLSVIRDFVGYGIGRNMIMEPQVPCDGVEGRGRKLKAPQILHLHVILAEKGWRVTILEDGWTAETADGGASALFTAMVSVQEEAARMTFDPLSTATGEHR